MKDVKLIKVFVSCPSDIGLELDSIKLIFDQINKTSGQDNSYHLESISWDADIYTGVGEDGQEVINTQMDGKYDILLAIIWQRMGTPTKRDKSGTAEEINKAIKEKLSGHGIELMIYFNTSPPLSLNDINFDQLKEVTEFKTSLRDRGVLYKEYDSIVKFDNLLRVNMSRLISEQIISAPKEVGVLPTQTTTLDKYREIEDILNQPDSSELFSYDNINEPSAQIQTSFYLMTESLTTMTNIIGGLGPLMDAKTEEINKNNKIKDSRLRQKKGSIIINSLAVELSDFNTRLGAELPIFKEHLNDGLNGYYNLFLAIKDYQPDENKKATIDLRNSLENATRSCAKMLKSIMELPPLNYKFNDSKRLTVSILKELTKELLNGLNLLDELTE